MAFRLRIAKLKGDLKETCYERAESKIDVISQICPDMPFSDLRLQPS